MMFSLDEDVYPKLVVEAYSYETDRTQLAEIWRDNNAVDGTEVNVKHQMRSLSVGDIVKVGHGHWLVRPMGWENVPGPKLTQMITQDQRRQMKIDKLNQQRMSS